MLPALKTVLGRLNLTLLGIAVLCATFWFTDHTTNRHPAAPRIDPAAVEALHQASANHPHVYVLIIDSLRYATATSPELMPNLCELRKEGVYGKVRASFNSSTAAGLRDAFTGRENAAVLAVVATFLKTDAGVESIFHQLALKGITSAVYGMDYFTQFGNAVTFQSKLGVRAPPDLDDANILAGAEALHRGDYDFVVGHLNYCDYAAHDFGIMRPEYRHAFQRADALIPKIRALLPPDATFVVMGDHGHDQMGKHGFGMDVPSFTVYVGPPFRRNFDLGSLTLPCHRYLMSHAAKIRFNAEGYSGVYLPEALKTQDDQLEWLLAQARAARGQALGRSWSVWIYLSLLASLWFNLTCRGHTPLNFSGPRSLALWLAIVPFFLTGLVQLITGMGVMAFLLVLLAWRMEAKKFLVWVVVPTAAGIAFQGWGRALIALKPALQGVSYTALTGFWICIGVTGALLATRERRAAVTASLLATTLLLFEPTNDRFGFPPALVPLLLCWMVFFVASVWRDGALKEKREAVLKLLLATVGIFFLVQPLAMSEFARGIFVRWHSLVPQLDLDNLPYLVLIALLAKTILFFPKWPGLWRALLAGTLILLLVLLEGRALGFDAYTMLALIGASLVGWLYLGVRLKRPEGRMFKLTFWFLLYYYEIGLTPRNYLEIGCLIGAIVLGARAVSWYPQKKNLRFDFLALMVFGLLVTGWASMRWTSSELEWHVLYQFFREVTVERNAGFFIPWIALKCLIPWALILTCLRDELGKFGPSPANALLVIFTVKMISMLMINTGLGGIDTLNRSYLEAACVSGVLAVLFLGVILRPRTWPYVPPIRECSKEV